MRHKMHKNVLEYKAVVWDMDGTLYFQPKLRTFMAIKLVTYYALHIFSIKDLFILKKFREVRDEWDSVVLLEGDNIDRNLPLETQQYEYVATLMKTTSDNVKCIIERWIYVEPLDTLKKCKDNEAVALMNRIKLSGNDNFILSDYPVEDKLEALEIEVDGCFAATDEKLGVMKPDPKGLFLISKELNIPMDEILMIGDRMSKDGKAAINAGCDYVILSKRASERNEFYKSTKDMTLY